MATFAVEIVTPERVALECQAESVVVPAFDGELGVLAHHAPLIAQLQVGEIRIRQGAELKLFAVSGGFVEVSRNKMSIFAETAEGAEEIDVERARLAAERAKSVLQQKQIDMDIHLIEATLKRALVRLRVAETSRRRKTHAS